MRLSYDFGFRIERAFDDTKTLVSLGFSFGGTNMDFMPVTKSINQVFATAYRESESNIEQITMQLQGLTELPTTVNVHVNALTSSQLLLEFWKNIDLKLL